MVHEGLQVRVRDREHPAPLLSPSWYGAEDRWPAWREVVRHRTSLRRAAAIAALTLVATSVAPVRAQTRYYVLFPDNHQPAAAQNVVTFSGGSPSSSYSVRMAQAGDTPSSPADSLLNVEFFQDNQRIRVTPQAVTPTAFAAVYDDDGAVGTDAEVDAGVYEGASTTAALLFIVSVRYDASARFTDGQLIGDQRWGTPRIEVYEGATADPALAFAWVAHGAGTRTWSTGDPGTAYRCKVGGADLTFATWPASPGEDSALFTVTPATTSGSSGSGSVSFNAAPDYETPTDSGGDNLYKVRVGNGHSLNDIFGEGLRSGCTGSGLDLEVLVKDAGPPAPVRTLTGDLDSGTMTISVTWTPPAGFLDGSDSSVVVPFDTARRSGSGNPGTAVVGYDYEYRLEGSSTWTEETTTSTSFEIPGVGADDAYRVRVRARNGEGAGAFTTIDVPRPLEPETPEPETPEPETPEPETPEPSNQRPSVSASCDPCTVAPGGEVQLTATASDPDGDDLTYAWSASEGVFRGGTDAAKARWTASEATGPVRFRVLVSDGHGGSASATVTVEVTNQPPGFESTRYGFELRENIDGSRRPVDLGTVAAPDPDGDEVTYELAVGDRSRFTVGARDGIVRYVGPGEDFESKPNVYKLSVRARDPHGAVAEVRVTVTVVNVNEAPEPEDDDAATDEDVVVTVDVLANDTDPDGDRLRVESVSAPAHGTTSVAGGGVRYAPELNYHGTDRFTYVVSDGNGETAVAAVEVTVLPVNDAPEAVGVIPDQALDEGGGETTVELTPFFDDVDGDALAYRASSSDPSVAMAAVSGAVLTLAPVEYGSATVTVTAEDEGGLSATQAFVVGVSDRLVRGVVSETLAGMARSHLASARMMLGRRVTAGRAEAPRVTVLGRRVPLGQAAARTAAERLVSGWLSSWVTPRGGRAGAPEHGAGAAAGFSEPAMGPVSMSGMPAATGPGGMAGVGRGSSGSLGGLGILGGFGGGRDPLRASEFLLALGGRQDAAEGSDPAGRWQMWGQGDIQAFEGAPSTATGYEGELQTGYVGMDRWLTERWLVGVAAARSRGHGNWRAGGSRGSLATTLTALHPYVQWSDETTSVWAAAGGGWGEVENVRRSRRTGTSGLGLRLGLVELRRRLGAAGGGVEFGVRGDAAWARLRTGAGSESIDGQTAQVNQLRVGAEASRPVRLGAVSLAPFGEAHARRDGGAGQTGEGVEVIAGLRAAAGRVRVDAQGRMLAVHSAAGYSERGLGVTLSVGNQDQEGLLLSVSPRWGNGAAPGGGPLWHDQLYRRYLPKAAHDQWELDARGGYGMPLPSGRLLTWFGSLRHSPFGRRFEVGGRLGVFD